jgi:hypothetical protein
MFAAKGLQGGHVEVEHGSDSDARGLVRAGNGVGPKQAGFLSCIEVELDGRGGLEAVGDHDTESLHHINRTAAVVVSARSTTASGVSVVDRVHVGTNDDPTCAGVAARDSANDGLLVEAAVRELADLGTSRGVGVGNLGSASVL